MYGFTRCLLTSCLFRDMDAEAKVPPEPIGLFGFSESFQARSLYSKAELDMAKAKSRGRKMQRMDGNGAKGLARLRHVSTQEWQMLVKKSIESMIVHVFLICLRKSGHSYLDAPCSLDILEYFRSF